MYNTEEFQKNLGCSLDDQDLPECIFLDDQTQANAPLTEEPNILLESFTQALDTRLPPKQAIADPEPESFNFPSPKVVNLDLDLDSPTQESPNNSFSVVHDQASYNGSRKPSDGDDIRILDFPAQA